ncbi:MAG: reverse transcriptase domain-containing protein [Patescibacteria group bacterium]|jgi:RNA-directed DNA polymerase
MFEKIISLENLFISWEEFKKGKANRNEVMEFEINLEDNIFGLHEDLRGGVYKHSGYSSFFIHDPKRRHIHKASVRDRLVHHAIHRIIEPEWDKIFIFDSWSSRKNKGTHGAVRRLQDFGLKLSHNYTVTLWVLKLDIKKFFDSVDHVILLQILEQRINDRKLMRLLNDIIYSYYPGLPLGNLTSQLFASIYLNQFDQFIKHELKIIGYIRYVDDFILLHTDRNILINCLNKIIIFLHKHLHLSIHLEKIELKRYTTGIDYLGYVCFPGYSILRTKTKRRMLKRINEKNLSSYNGVLKHCRSRKLQYKLLEKINSV